MGDAREVLRRVTFEATSVDDLPLDRLRACLDQHSIIRIRGLFDPEQISALRRQMTARFDPRKDRKHDPRDVGAVRTNLQKIVVGGGQGSTGRELARFVRILYNPIFCDDIYGMRAHLVTLARVRNHLGRVDPDFAVHGIEESQFTAARIQQYPRGGGFMASHRDYFSVANATDSGADYAQPVLIMSRYGEDYVEGGAYIVHGGERILYEACCEPGDVIAYDGRSTHGVADVDPLEPIDLTTFSGRVAALVSLYRVLEPGAKDYRELDGRTRDLLRNPPARP